MSDIMDEFEFKPLTEGLGFHKKIQDSPTQSVIGNDGREKNRKNFSTDEPQELSSLQLDAMLGTLGKNRIPDISTPLPRTSHSGEKVDVTSASQTELPTTTVDEILKTLQEKKRPSLALNTGKTRIDATPEPIKFNPTIWDFSAFTLDLMLILASNLLCLIILLITTRVDLFANLYNPDSAGMIYFSLAALFLGTTWIYLVVNRIFLGCTPGEWVFDQRLGFPQETGTASYSLKIVLRTTIIILSGMIVFPLISLALHRDVLGRWLGIPMMKKA
jgi:hypothetical protein